MHGCAFHLPTLSSSCLTPPFFLHLLPPLLDVSTASAPLTSNPEYELVVEANNITAEIDNEISASAIPLCLSSELTSATNHKPTQYYTTPHTHTTHTHTTHTHTHDLTCPSNAQLTSGVAVQEFAFEWHTSNALPSSCTH